MNPLVVEVLRKQMRTLFWVYYLLSVCVGGAVVASILLDPPELDFFDPGPRCWLELGIGGISVLLLFLVVPWVRGRFFDLERVRTAGRDTFSRWGLPDSVDVSLGRQAIFLSRYTAGCILSWILILSVSFYGLMGRILLGVSVWLVGFLLAAAVFSMWLLPPNPKRVNEMVGAL